MSVETQYTKQEARKTKHRNVPELLAAAVMLLGIVMVCQPLFHGLFRWGFVVTLAGIVAFTVASHRRR